MPRVLFTDAAQADLADTLSWYEAHAPEIVSRFREALRAIVARIERNPRQFTPSRHAPSPAPPLPLPCDFSRAGRGCLCGRGVSHKPRSASMGAPHVMTATRRTTLAAM